MRPAEKRIEIMTHHLYKAMPGARPVPVDPDGANLWVEVMGEDHYVFCDRIARLIEAVDIRTHAETD